METIILLKEINILSSGETGAYVELYLDQETALSNMKEQISENIRENKSRIEWEDNESAKLVDDNENVYMFSLESATIKGSGTLVHIDWGEEGTRDMFIFAPKEEIRNLFTEYNKLYDSGKFQDSFQEYLTAKSISFKHWEPPYQLTLTTG